MSINAATEMDVDAPSGTLKRSSSAPMINENNTAMTTSPSPSSSTRDQSAFNIFSSSEQTRTRRYSTSFSPVHGSPSSGVRLTPRISQLRQEECADTSNMRELAHEREIHHTMQISQSWEDLRLVPEPHDGKKMMVPLQINLPTYNFLSYASASPTRLNSPGFQSPTKPTRSFIRRSASPVLRPSTLGAKRKLDEDKSDFYRMATAKRFHHGTGGGCGNNNNNNNGNITDRGGLLTTTTTNNNNNSANNVTNSTSSPIPGSLSSVGTPESLSSADSPGFNFRMMDSPSPNRVHGNNEPMMVVVSSSSSKSDQEMSESLS